MSEVKHSVTLQSDLCKGCTHCIKRCPTEAIRVRNGKAVIRSERCIDCGECIRQCPYQAKRAIYDKLEKFKDYKYKIALPAPALYGQFDKVEDIDFDALPNQFVIKANHDSGGLCVCKDKAKGIIVRGKSDDQRNLSYDEVRKVLKHSLKKNYYWGGREWPYKNIKRRILVEQYMQQSDGSGLNDYKFFCFNGEPKYVWMGTNYTPMHFDVYSVDWQNQHVAWGYVNAPEDVPPPPGYEQMLEMARKLSQGMPHVRVDFFNIDGKIYVGEFTFYTWGGFCPFNPPEWDQKFGELIDLSKVEIIK